MIISKFRVTQEQPVISWCQDERLCLWRHGFPLSSVDPYRRPRTDLDGEAPHVIPHRNEQLGCFTGSDLNLLLVRREIRVEQHQAVEPGRLQHSFRKWRAPQRVIPDHDHSARISADTQPTGGGRVDAGRQGHEYGICYAVIEVIIDCAAERRIVGWMEA